MEINVAQYGNCYGFNSKYNHEDDTLFKLRDTKYVSTGKRRLSSLTGPSFGLNLIVALDQIDYMKGGVTKQVRFKISCEFGDFFMHQLRRLIHVMLNNYRLACALQFMTSKNGH